MQQYNNFHCGYNSQYNCFTNKFDTAEEKINIVENIFKKHKINTMKMGRE
jgi:hypothetical protein